MSSQTPKRTHSWKRAKSDTTLLKGRSFTEFDKKGKVSKTARLKKGKRRNSNDDCDEEAKKYDCMPQQVAKDGRLMLEVRSGKKRLQVWKACRVQLVMSTSYAMNTFGKKQFILMCITGGLLGLSKRYLSVPLADIHAIYKGGADGNKQPSGAERLTFVLQTSDKQLHFRAANDGDMLDWVAEVKASLAVEKANGFLPSIFHVRIGPDQQVPMTDALLAFHPHRSPEQLHIRQALSETTLYACHIADILRFGFAHDGALLWVESQPRDSPLATEKILLLCPNNSRGDVVQALQCNLQSVLGGAGHTVQTSGEHQTVFAVRDRFAVSAGGVVRRRPLSVNLGAQSHQPRGAIRRHGAQQSPFKRGAGDGDGRPLSDEPVPEDEDDGGGDWRMDVQRHKAQLVKHMHRNLLRQRSRSLGCIPAQGMPLPMSSKPALPPAAIVAVTTTPLHRAPYGREFLDTFAEDERALEESGEESDGCVRALPQHGAMDTGIASARPVAQPAATEHTGTAVQDGVTTTATVQTDTQTGRSPPPQPPPKARPTPPTPPLRHESHNRLMPLTKASVAQPRASPPGKKAHVPVRKNRSRDPCYGELESRASLDSSRECSPEPPLGRGENNSNLLQVPPAADNVSTSSEPYVYDHLQIKAEYEDRMRREAAATRHPPQLETIENDDDDDDDHQRRPIVGDRLSIDSWDDGDDYVPVSQSMHVKPSDSDDDSDDDDARSAGEYIRLKDALTPHRSRTAPLPTASDGRVAETAAMATTTTTTTTAMTPAGAEQRVNERSNCNSVFSCVSTIAGSVDDFSQCALHGSLAAANTGAAAHHAAAAAAAALAPEEADYDYPRSSRRTTVVVSSPSSPSPSCSSLSGSNSMEEIAASLWSRQRSNTMPGGTGSGKQRGNFAMPNGDTASFVGSLRKGASSANGGQQDRIIEDLLARLSPSRCRSPYHSGIGMTLSRSGDGASGGSPPQSTSGAASLARTSGAASLQPPLPHSLMLSAADDGNVDLLSPRQLTERASISCHDLLQQLTA